MKIKNKKNNTIKQPRDDSSARTLRSKFYNTYDWQDKSSNEKGRQMHEHLENFIRKTDTL